MLNYQKIETLVKEQKYNELAIEMRNIGSNEVLSVTKFIAKTDLFLASFIYNYYIPYSCTETRLYLKFKLNEKFGVE